MIVTQRRLCSQKFDESLVEDGESLFLTERTGAHPLEDGCPWCPLCRERVDRAAEALLAGVVGLDSDDSAREAQPFRRTDVIPNEP